MTGAAQFEVVAGRAAGTTIAVQDELLIGRGATGVGRLADDDEISRQHARVTLDRSGFCAIEDLGSTNGTFVNGLRIGTPTTLGANDTIEVGGTTLVLRSLPSRAATPAAAAVPPPPVTEVAETASRPPSAAEVPTTLSVQVDVDFAAGTAELTFKDRPEPQRFTLVNGAWRPLPPTEKESPQ